MATPNRQSFERGAAAAEVGPSLAVVPEDDGEDDPAVADPASVGALIARAQAGDRMAFGRLIEEHYDQIFRTAFKWSGTRSDAEDVAQEVCIKLATALAGFDGRSSFATWLYRITLNAVRDVQRQGGRRRRQATALQQVMPAEQPPDQEEAATMGQLWQAVRKLPEKQRDAVLLVYAEELSHAGAATIMGCKEATVSWHIFEAKRALKGLL
jgi:RNA polymerase sigma-70 factor (ECF subfamily)